MPILWAKEKNRPRRKHQLPDKEEDSERSCHPLFSKRGSGAEGEMGLRKTYKSLIRDLKEKKSWLHIFFNALYTWSWAALLQNK